MIAVSRILTSMQISEDVAAFLREMLAQQQVSVTVQNSQAVSELLERAWAELSPPSSSPSDVE